MKKIFKSIMFAAIAAFIFTACEDVPAPYIIPGTEEEEPTPEGVVEGDGSIENPFNTLAAIKYINSLESGAESPSNIYIKGKIVSVKEEFTTQYGNGTFYISDDGTTTNQLYIYRALYLGNQKFKSGDTQIAVGDEVIICGLVTLYSGNTPETVQNKAYIYSLNGNVIDGGDDTPGEAKGSGTLADPYNAVAANNAANALADNATSAGNVYIKGKVVSVKEQYGTQFGNATFYISDDGTPGNQFYVYRALYLGNQKYTSGDLIKEGDEVVVCGKITKYVSAYGTTLETVQNEAFLYSLNGKSEGTGGTDTPTGDVGSIDAPKTVAEALTAINALEEGATTDAGYYVKGKVASIATAAADIGPNSSSGKNYKDINYYISTDGSENNTIYVYRGKNLNNTDFISADQLKVGDEVIVYGKLQKYKNTKTNETVPEMAQGNYLVKTSNTSAGADALTPSGSGFGSLDGNKLTLVTSDLKVENGKEPGTIKLADGTTISFDGGGNTNTPKYYDSGTSIRMYPKNNMTLKANGKTIQSITMSCSSQSGTLCNASGDVTASPGTVAFSGDDVNITGINSASTTITNTNGATGAASQLRFSKIVITYAN